VNARVPQELGARVESAWMAAMRAGDFESAWRATDLIELPRRARQREAGFVRDPSHLVWDGTPFDDKVVRVRCLHGLGDTLQFMRFVPRVAARAKRVHFLVQPMLLDLLRGAPGLGDVSNAWTDDPPAADVEIEVMELAYALRCRSAADVPPYPHLASQLPATRCVPVPRDGRLRVALLWSASDWDTSRSIPLELLRDLVQVPSTAFYSLQQGPAALDPLVQQLGITALSPRTGSIVDAASAMMQMDLVISVDGMPAHLAATLGRPTWLMLKHDADWRWMEARCDSPWYPSMRLFRQARAGDWMGVVRQVSQALRHLAKR
jgi:hypothetical protein